MLSSIKEYYVLLLGSMYVGGGFNQNVMLSSKKGGFQVQKVVGREFQACPLDRSIKNP